MKLVPKVDIFYHEFYLKEKINFSSLDPWARWSVKRSYTWVLYVGTSG